MREPLLYQDLRMEVGTVSAVVKEFNLCLDLIKSLVKGYYGYKARQRTLPTAVARARAAISAAEQTAQRLDRLLMLEMAPVDFDALNSAVWELKLQTYAALKELRRYVPAAELATAGTVAVAERSASAVDAVHATTTEPALRATRQAAAGSSNTGTVAAADGDDTGRSHSTAATAPLLPRSRGAAAGGDASLGADMEAGASCWAKCGRVPAAFVGTLVSDICGAQRQLLDDALGALREACSAVDEARRKVSVAPQRPILYVRPPLFDLVAEKLYSGREKIVVVCGAPAFGKTALSEEIQWLVNSQKMLATKFRRAVSYRCQGGKCENIADLFRSWTGRDAPSDVTDEGIAQDLADDAGKSESLLVLENLNDPACFYQHQPLAQLVLRLGNSCLLITTRNEDVCLVLPEPCCFTLTRTDNEKHVMSELAARLVRGKGSATDADAASVEVQASIETCVKKCQGSPHLLKLVDSAVRLRILDAGRRSIVNTLSNDLKDVWSECAEQLPSMTAQAQAASAHFNAYATLNHEVYLQVLRQVTAPPHGSSTPTPAACMAKAVLRIIVQLSSSEWYLWSAVAEAAAEEVTLATPRRTHMEGVFGALASRLTWVMPTSTSPARSNDGGMVEEAHGGDCLEIPLQQDDSIAQSPFVQQFDPQLLADINAALRLLVRHRVLEAQEAEAGQGRKAAVRFHELLKDCVEQCDEARGLVGVTPDIATANVPRPILSMLKLSPAFLRS